MAKRLGASTFFLILSLTLMAPALADANFESKGSTYLPYATVQGDAIGHNLYEKKPTPPWVGRYNPSNHQAVTPQGVSTPANGLTNQRSVNQQEEREMSATWISILISAMLVLLIVIFLGSWRARNR